MSDEITAVLVRNGAWIDEFYAVPCTSGGYTLLPHTEWSGAPRDSWAAHMPFWCVDRDAAEQALEYRCRECATAVESESYEDGPTRTLIVQLCTNDQVDREVKLK